MSELQALHDRATRGLPLSDEERAQLAQWYAQEDEVEMRLLDVPTGTDYVDLLQTQIKAALAQVAGVTQQIQHLVLQNEELRREVTVLKQNLAQRVTVSAL